MKPKRLWVVLDNDKFVGAFTRRRDAEAEAKLDSPHHEVRLYIAWATPPQTKKKSISAKQVRDGAAMKSRRTAG